MEVSANVSFLLSDRPNWLKKLFTDFITFTVKLAIKGQVSVREMEHIFHSSLLHLWTKLHLTDASRCVCHPTLLTNADL